MPKLVIYKNKLERDYVNEVKQITIPRNIQIDNEFHDRDVFQE
jgi:hypothetical protein